MGPPISRSHPLVDELSRNSLEGQGVVGVNLCLAHLLNQGAGGFAFTAARDAGVARQRARAGGCAYPRLRRFMQWSKIRGAGNGKVETSRGRKKSTSGIFG